jgi:replicative DNA helicase
VRDENDRLKDGTLPDDPASDARVVSEEVPRVLTVRDLVNGAAKRAYDKRSSSFCTTGNYRLDSMTGGLLPGFVWAIGASTSWGKSSLLVMIADENLKRKKRVLIVSSEDSEHIYGDRILLRRSRVNADNLRRKRLTEEEREKVTDVARRAEDLPVFLDARGKSVEWLGPRIKKLIVEHSIDLVAFDYLQAFDNQRAQQDRRNQISYIARVLTDITKTAIPGGIAGIIFSQITEQETKRTPDKNSIRESRDVSHAAEVVLLGFTPTQEIESEKWGTADMRDKDGNTIFDKTGKPRRVIPSGQRVLFADKVKNGPRGAVLPIDWDENSACFDALDDPEARRLQQVVGEDFSSYGDDF